MRYEDILSQRIQNLNPSGIRKFFDLLQEMEDTISLGVGEPDFQTPWHIREAGVYSLEKGFTRYTSNAGLMELRREISAYMDRHYHLSYDPETQILVTVGGSEGLDLAFRALIDPGDEVIIPVPSFVCYGPMVEMAGGVPVYLEMKEENQFRLTPQELAPLLTKRTKALLLPFPSNPTGGIMEREDLEAVARVLEGTSVMVVSDEIYAELTYGGLNHVSMANLPQMQDRTIVINGLSKSHSMTGWRMGFACGPAPILAQMIKLHQFGIMSAPTTSQYAAVEALRNGDRDVVNMREEYDGRRRFLVSGLRKLGLSCFEPKGAFYVFPCIRGLGLTSDEFCERLLLSQGVAVISGSAFGPGGEGYVRCCYAASMQDLTKALDRIGAFLKELKP